MSIPVDRPRVRDLGLSIGVLPPGPLNAITDIAGVRVGHCTSVLKNALSKLISKKECPPTCS